MKKILAQFLLVSTISSVSNAALIPKTAELEIELSLPKIETYEYHRPYVAVWLEDVNNQPVTTLQLWAKEDDWYKDLRSWWRKIGRYETDKVDVYSSATRPAGVHRFRWSFNNKQVNSLNMGEYSINVEIVRESGGRSFLKQRFTFSDSAFKQTIDASNKQEIQTLSVHYKLN